MATRAISEGALAIGRNGIARAGTVARANSASADVNKNFRRVHLFGRVRVLKLSLLQFQPFSNSCKMSHRYIGSTADQDVIFEFQTGRIYGATN